MSQAVGLEFIKEPFLRITPRQCLNDPFECLPSESTKEELSKLFKKSSIQVENEEMFFNDLNSFIGMHGIISLSESPDNLLMWSHYADEHKGIVVEFEVDEHDPFDLFITHIPPESSDAKFGRVSYRKSRKYPYDIDKKSINSIRDYYYLSKSDEWIYEKEFRFITPYTLVNSLICNTKNTHWKKAFQVSGIPIPDKISNNIVKTDILPPIENLFPTWFHSHNTGAIFLVNINSKRINKIVLGAKADKEKFLSLMEEYECRDPYKSYYCSFSNKHINVEQAEVDPDRYELVFNKL
jgi:hypothetical protein